MHCRRSCIFSAELHLSQRHAFNKWKALPPFRNYFPQLCPSDREATGSLCEGLKEQVNILQRYSITFTWKANRRGFTFPPVFHVWRLSVTVSSSKRAVFHVYLVSEGFPLWVCRKNMLQNAPPANQQKQNQVSCLKSFKYRKSYKARLFAKNCINQPNQFRENQRNNFSAILARLQPIYLNKHLRLVFCAFQPIS